MTRDDSNIPLDYASPIAERNPMATRWLLLTWGGAASFFVFYFVGGVIAASGEYRAVVGIFLLLCALGPITGLVFAIISLRRTRRYRVAIGWGLTLNAIILCIHLGMFVKFALLN
jgi:hypothetical protein